MVKKKVILIGGGGHARIVIDIFKKNEEYEIIGLTDSNRELFGQHIDGIPVIGDDKKLKDIYYSGVRNAIIGVGGSKSNKSRAELFNKVSSIDFNMVNAIHPSAILASGVSLGSGVVIFPGVVINVGTNIGNNVIIATGSTVDHETTIKDHVLISAGVNIGGNVFIGEGSLIAIGATVVSSAKICKNVLVGAGAVVVKDILEEGIYVGIPARIMKTKKDE